MNFTNFISIISTDFSLMGCIIISVITGFYYVRIQQLKKELHCAKENLANRTGKILSAALIGHGGLCKDLSERYSQDIQKKFCSPEVTEFLSLSFRDQRKVINDAEEIFKKIYSSVELDEADENVSVLANYIAQNRFELYEEFKGKFEY